MPSYSFRELESEDLNQNLMCKILKKVDEQGLLEAKDLDLEGYREVEIDKQLKHLKNKGYIKEGGAGNMGVPLVMSPDRRFHEGLEKLCSPWWKTIWNHFKAGPDEAAKEVGKKATYVIVSLLLALAIYLISLIF